MEKITSRRNPVCVHIKKLGESKGYRDSCGEFLCDGLKLLEDALRSGAEITTVFTTAPVQFPLPVETRVYYADRSLIDSISPLKTAQGSLFTCKMPEAAGCEPVTGTHILLDGIQDPGNVGAIIRTANAFGIDSVILTEGCADPYNPKSIRASMGAIFRQCIAHLDLNGLRGLKDQGVRIVGATAEGSTKDISEVMLKGSVIAIGNEGRGLSKEILSLCSERIWIPISTECESLNAASAAAIIIWKASG